MGVWIISSNRVTAELTMLKNKHWFYLASKELACRYHDISIKYQFYFSPFHHLAKKIFLHYLFHELCRDVCWRDQVPASGVCLSQDLDQHRLGVESEAGIVSPSLAGQVDLVAVRSSRLFRDDSGLVAWNYDSPQNVFDFWKREFWPGNEIWGPR